MSQTPRYSIIAPCFNEEGVLPELHRRIREVMDDLPQTRKELGYPPLVTPTSQIVGNQAVMNVLFGRYKLVPAEVKGVAYGLYGKTPGHMDKKVQKIILKGYERGEEPTTKRPGEILEPEWDKAVEADQGPGQKRRRHPYLCPLPHHRGSLPQVEVRPRARSRGRPQGRKGSSPT